MIARLIKTGSFKRQSISEPTDEEADDLVDRPKAQSAPSTRNKIKQSTRFSLATNASTTSHHSSSHERHKARRPSFTCPDSWWASYYLRIGAEEAPRLISRSYKHDYRNPDSNYSDVIVDALRKTHQEDNTLELDLQHRLNPFLSKDFLNTLQRFGLFPEPDDDDEEEDEEFNKEWSEGHRRRTRSDASHSRSQTDIQTSDDNSKKSERRPSLQDVTNPVTALPNVSIILRKKLFQKRSRRWTVTASSFRSIQRIGELVTVP